MKQLSLVKNRYVIQELVRKSVKTQYRSSFLGMIWTVLNPLLNTLVMYLVFSQILRNNDKTYILYILTGNIMFSALSSATNGGLSSIVHNRGLLGKIKIDPYLFPLASTLTSIVNMAFSMIALLIIMTIVQFGVGISVFSFRIFVVILMIPAFVLFEYGIALFLSAIYVFCRDIKYLYSVFLKLWMYLTPIFYNISRIDKSSFAYKCIRLNPMYYFVRFFRDAMYMGWSEYPIQDLHVLYLLGLGSLIIGLCVFKSLKKHFMTNI